MLKLNEIKVAAGSRKKAKRVGRGQGSGSGCTSGYGMNGDKARSGSRLKLYFEGGQTPLSRRIPKRGFNNPSKISFQIVNVGDLEKGEFEAVELDPKWFFENGYIHSDKQPVKILGNGEITKKLTIRAEAFSKSAREKIEQAKGKAEVISRA